MATTWRFTHTRMHTRHIQQQPRTNTSKQLKRKEDKLSFIQQYLITKTLFII